MEYITLIGNTGQEKCGN